MDRTVLSFLGFGRNLSSPEQISEGEHAGSRERSGTRITVLVSMAMLAMVAAAIGRWRRYRTYRALLALPAWQRADCGMDCPDIPTACDLEAAARRRIARGLRADWS